MYKKKNKLSILQGNPVEIDIIEIKRVIQLTGGRGRKNARGKNEGKSHYVIENTWIKNVRNRPCHYIYENNAHRGRLPLY